MHDLLLCIVYTVGGYLSGNIMYAYWLPKWIRGVDVREYGADHNPGAANATVACGLPIGITCAVMDILKGAVPVYLAMHMAQLPMEYMVPVVLAPVIGHGWPLLFNGRGGKAICVSFGVLIGLLPEILLAPLWAVIILVLLPFIHNHAMLMVVTSTAMSLGSFLLYPMIPIRLMACGVSGILIVRHRKPKERTPQTEKSV
jgi:acyl phosphate:glycerol-3-phosphate acyltransferase